MYLIDGHNLIGQGIIPGINLAQEDDEARLVLWLRARQSNLRKKMVVVFDGGIPGGTSQSLSGAGVTVLFAAQYRSDADHMILSRVRKAPRAEAIIVVTNDAGLRAQVARLGARLMRGDAFLQRLQRPARGSNSVSPKERPNLSKQEVEEFLQLFGADDEVGD